MSVVSSALSRVSTRSSPWKISPRLASFMDSIFAIGFGLGLRFVVDAVSQHDFKLTGTLVGLWEGIILLHFLKKMPKSTDPYVAYAVRLFVDFLCTESVARLVLVLIWTGMGMVLADITPALWDDVGLNRIWRRFRRDLYTLFRMIPTVAFFPPPRTVRFSPSREPSIIIEEPSVLDSQPPSIVTTEQTATTPNTVPATTITSSAPAAREVLRRRVPGYFPADYSDTDTDLGSIRAGPSMGRTSRRLSVYPQVPDYDSVTDLSSANDLDEANLSSGASSASTERAGPSSITFDTAVIPDMEEEEEEQQQLLVDTAVVPAKDEEERTPRQPASMYLPPTPSDSALRWRPRLEPDEPLPVRPFSSLPQIPDFLEEPTTEDLEKIQPPAAEKPPTPPAKDDLPSRFAIPPVPSNPPPEPRRAPPSPEAEWEILNPFAAPEATTSNNRQSLPPAYRESEEFDDIYGEEYVAPPPATTAADAFGSGVGVNDKGKGVDLGAQTRLIDDGITSPLGAPFNLTFGGNAAANPWDLRAASGAAPDLFDAARQEGEEKERLKLEAEAEDAAVAEAARLEEEERVAAEAAAAKQKEEERIAAEAAAAAKEAEEEAERKRKEDEAATEKEREAEELRKKEEEEKAERKRKEVADELARQQRRLEKEAAEKKKAEEEEAARKAEEERKEEEEKQRKAEEEATRKAEEKRIKEEKQQKKLEKARKAEEKRRKEEEALAVKKAEEAEAAKIAQEAEKEQRRKDTEAAAARREKARLEKEEKEKQERETAEAAREAEEKRKQEELAKAKADEEAAEAAAASAAVAVALEKERQEQEEQMAKEEADKLKEAQTEAQQQQEETPAATTTGAADPTSSQDAQQALDNTPKRNQRDLPPTPTSPEPTNGQLADETITPEDPVQANELEESPNDADDQESVVTDASAMPSDVGIRLQRLLLAKAQMIDVRDRIEELKRKLEIPEEDHASISEQLKVDEKILKKMEKKEQRRYDEGVASHLHLSSMDAQDSISYGTLNPKDTGLKTEEKLEELMRPGVKALTITLIATTGRKGPGAKQKSKLIETLEDYNLFNNAREDINNGRTLHVNLPEEEFRQWLLDYRAAVTAPQDDLYS